MSGSNKTIEFITFPIPNMDNIKNMPDTKVRKNRDKVSKKYEKKKEKKTNNFFLSQKSFCQSSGKIIF